MENIIIAGMFGQTEIIVIVVLLVLLFGGRKIPELMKGIGKGIKEFKNANKEDSTEVEKDDKK